MAATKNNSPASPRRTRRSLAKIGGVAASAPSARAAYGAARVTADDAGEPRPSLAKMLWRGARRRCPWCGGRGAFFTGWFAKQDRCRTCGLGWQRGYEGFELGAMAINIIVVFGTLIVGLIVAVAVTAAGHPCRRR